MKPKAQIKKQKTAVHSEKQTIPETAAAETSWLQSADFFRISNLALRISAESTSLKEFNSEF